MRITVDLVKVIEQAAPQVWGGDERDMLYAWLARNTEPTQMVIVTVDVDVFFCGFLGGRSIFVTCVSCHREIEVPVELIGDNFDPDHILSYICDECETERDEVEDEWDHECPCGCEGDESRCVYALSYKAAAEQTLAAELLSSSNNQASADQPQLAEA
jgi:hypothetical protein